jgi:hypothetical protein
MWESGMAVERGDGGGIAKVKPGDSKGATNVSSA